MKVTIYTRQTTKPYKFLQACLPLTEGPFYLRYSRGGKQVCESVGSTPAEALKQRERVLAVLQAEKLGLVVSNGIATARVPQIVPSSLGPTTWEAIDAYCVMLETKVKRNGRRYNPRSIKSRKSELHEFINFCGKLRMSEITRPVILSYKDHMQQKLKLAGDTVINKMMTVTTWLKHNPLFPVDRILKTEDWPMKKETKAYPFRKEEVVSMLKVAKGDEAILIRLFKSTGMRLAEVQHLEFEDIRNIGSTWHIWVHDKPEYGWETKTPSSVRKIAITESLAKELLSHGTTGLVFAGKSGCIRRLERSMERVGIRAGVKPPPEGDKADWCHRWRDTYATELVRKQREGWLKMNDRDIATLLGHKDTETLRVYVEALRQESEAVQHAAAISDNFAELMELAETS